MAEHGRAYSDDVRDWRLAQLAHEINELRDRMTRLESALARGILLLVANLAGVATSLFHQLMQR